MFVAGEWESNLIPFFIALFHNLEEPKLGMDKYLLNV